MFSAVALKVASLNNLIIKLLQNQYFPYPLFLADSNIILHNFI